ncbi:MAG TPA: hypothetical protein VG734_04745, partial [Lacunisphaera sp.]|nr:hypothetical protein [Lacunisphaera sp.]
MKKALVVLAAVSLLSPSIRAADSRATDDDLRIKGVFETALPKTERKSSLRLIVHPHLGDFSER